MAITKITELAHWIWKRYIPEGAHVLDATAGNGMDTEFLRELVGEGGLVYAMDIQEEAICRTRERIAAEKRSNIRFISDDHRNLDLYIEESIGAAVFNLGYLPRSEHKVRTKAESSLEAMEKALEKLSAGGILSVAAYLAHDEGEEYRRVRGFLAALDPKRYKVIEIDPINQSKFSPKLLICQKMGR